MLSIHKPTNPPLIKFYVGTGGVKKGQLAVVSSNTAVVASEGVTTAILIGIATDDFAAGVIGTFYDLRGAEVQADIYQGGATDAFVAANVGTMYDVYTAGTTNEFFIDPNDTADPMFALQSFNSENATATLRVKPTLLFL